MLDFFGEAALIYFDRNVAINHCQGGVPNSPQASQKRPTFFFLWNGLFPVYCHGRFKFETPIH